MKKLFQQAIFLEKLIYLYVLILPLNLGYLRFPFVVKLAEPADFLFLVVFFTWIGRKLRKKNVAGKSDYSRQVSTAKSIYFCITGLILAGAVSFTNSINLAHSFIDWLGLLYLSAVFVVLTDVIDSQVKLKQLLAVFVLSSLIVSLSGLSAFVGYFFSSSKDNLSRLLFAHSAESSLIFFPRIRSFFYSTNMFVCFSHIGLIASASLFFLKKKDKGASFENIFLISSVIVITISLVFSGAQAFLGVLVFIFLVFTRFNGRWASFIKYCIFLLTGVIMALALCATIWMIYPIKVDNDLQNKFISLKVNYAYSHHIIPSLYGLAMFKDHPFFGVGIGTFRDQYSKYALMDIEKISSQRIGERITRTLDPHNTYVGALAEWGFVGFLALVILFTGFFMLAGGQAGFVLRAGLATFFLNGLFVDIVMMRHLWVLFAIIFIARRSIDE